MFSRAGQRYCVFVGIPSVSIEFDLIPTPTNCRSSMKCEASSWPVFWIQLRCQHLAYFSDQGAPALSPLPVPPVGRRPASLNGIGLTVRKSLSAAFRGNMVPWLWRHNAQPPSALSSPWRPRRHSSIRSQMIPWFQRPSSPRVRLLRGRDFLALSHFRVSLLIN